MQKRILGLLFAVLFLVMIGFSILFPVEPYYIQMFGATSATMGWLTASYSLAQFVFSPLWGLSDRVGRKPVMLIGLAGYGASMTLFALGSLSASVHRPQPRGRAVVGDAAHGNGRIADTTTDEERAKGMGLLGAAFGLGAIFGPFLGGVLGDISIRLPFFTTGVLSLLTMTFVWRLLPESLPPEKRGGVKERVSRLKAFQVDTTWLYAIAFLVTFSLAGLETAFPFLAYDRLGATTRSVGYIFMVMGIAGSIVQGGLIGPIRKLIGEERMIPAGLLIARGGSRLDFGIENGGDGYGGIGVVCRGPRLDSSGQRVVGDTADESRARAGHRCVRPMDALGRVLGPVIGGTLYLYRARCRF